MAFNLGRRLFFKTSGALLLASAFLHKGISLALPKGFTGKGNMGVSPDGYSHIYLSQGGHPEENMSRVLKMMGGIQSIIGPQDIVILKPNAQWWNQGMTNTNAMKAFIEAVLSIPNFSGEIILAENHHFPEADSRGWTTDERNGDFNYNELVQYFQKRGYPNVTKYHWHDGGPSMHPSHGGAENGGVVKGPWDGDGYVWCDELVYRSQSGRKAMMSYPVFTSSYSGVTIDLKNGAWKDGQYLNFPVKLINFSSLNHHGNWAGVTASVKNYLGIADLTCGYRGLQPAGFYNLHFVGTMPSSLHWRLEKLRKRLGLGYISHVDGGAVGYFMRHVRMADLNIVTAEWVGWGSRTDTSLRAQARTVLASTDPVALDYYAAKNILLPLTPKRVKNKKYDYYYHKYNDPERRDCPLRWYLEECHLQGIGTLSPQKMKVHRHDFS